MNMLHVLVVVVTLLAFVVRWHYLMANVKAQSVDALSATWCDGQRLRPGTDESRRPRARTPASLRASSAMLHPPCKRDPDILLENEPIGQQPLVHSYTAYT